MTRSTPARRCAARCWVTPTSTARPLDRSTAGATQFTAPFQEFISRYAWGAVWTRPGLDRRERSMITLASLGREKEIEVHVRGALRNGLTPDEISELLIHTAVYAGVPAANYRVRDRRARDRRVRARRTRLRTTKGGP